MRSVGRSVMSVLPVPARFLMQRALLTPVFRFGMFVLLPVAVVLLGSAVWLSDDENRKLAMEAVLNAEATLNRHQRFNVGGLEVTSESPELRRYVEGHVGSFSNRSPFEIDPRSIKQRLEQLPAVTSATVNVVPAGNVEISVVERRPEAVMRRSGTAELLDRYGERAFSGNLELELERLPLITGEGADSKVAEALEIYAAAEPIRDSIRGLVRIGERRWDAVLDGNRVIQLPESDPEGAMKQLLAYERRARLLSRAIRAIDLRVPNQVVVRLAPEVAAEVMGRQPGDGT